MEPLGEWVMSNLISIRLETALVSVQDRCTVLGQTYHGSEIILDAPDEKLLGDMGHVESHLVCLEMVLVLM